jgi:CBS domain containing-hemolysin-like protein
LTVLSTLFLEMAARRLAWVAPERLGLALVPFYVIVQALTRPFLRPLIALAGGVARVLGGRGSIESDSGVTEDDIRLMVEAGRDLEESEKEMIHSIFELSETIAREIMVPRVDMVVVEKGMSLTEVLDRCLEKGLSRLPVYEETIDNVVGIVTAKDLLFQLREGRMETRLEEIIRPAFFVPASKRVDELLRDMQREKVAMAIVVDEYGGTDGLLTMEDLIEEIVGEIADEYDKEEPAIELLKDGSVLVDAKLIIEDVNQALDIDLPADEYETVGGYVYGLLGHVPKEGEKAEVDGLVVHVQQVERQRITRLRIGHADGRPFAPRGAEGALPATAGRQPRTGLS